MAPSLSCDRSAAGTLAAGAVQAAQSGTAVGIGATGTALIATAVSTTISGDAVVTTERGAALASAFSVRGALFTKTAITAALIAADRTTNALNTIKAAAAMGTGRATATAVAAAIERAIGGNAVVIAGHRAAVLAALI